MTQSAVYRFALIVFLLIQPLKIVSALIGINLLFLLLLPFLPYAHYLTREPKFLKIHSYVLAAQAVLTLWSFILAGSAWLDFQYFALFLLTPHFALMIFRTFSDQDRPFTVRAFTFYLLFLFGLSIASFILYSRSEAVPIGKLFTIDMLFRNIDSERWIILNSLNIGKNLFGLHDTAFEATALTIYPLIILTFLFVYAYWAPEAAICFVMSAWLLLMKGSRAEILYALILLAGIGLMKVWRLYFKWMMLPLVGFPFLQLALGSRMLSGRSVLNEIFLENQSLLGNGIGFTREKILIATNGDYGSMHNIHFEIILNFGWLIYWIALGGLLYFLWRVANPRVLFALTFLIFFLLGTNYELFDLYIGVLFGMIIYKHA